MGSSVFPAMKRLVGEAIAKYSLISEGDRILIAFSGGKDSFALVETLEAIRKRSPVKFEIIAVTIDAGFGGKYGKAGKFLEKLRVRHEIVKTDLKGAVEKTIEKGSTPGDYCFLCSRMRRGLLYKAAKDLGCNKVALGHNLDDAIETFELNFFFSSRTEAMRARQRADNWDLELIRPLILVPKRMTEEYAKERGFPIVKEKCFVKGKETNRLALRKMLGKLEKTDKHFHASARNTLGKLGLL